MEYPPSGWYTAQRIPFKDGWLFAAWDGNSLLRILW
ncbi:unnamed protein product [Staurois parvus]|uniref:Beta-fibrinogen n=1 Tax=Staurois parvus TaxID=386267 RepID=A0ABN9GR07_9NEOB|nr:unnamed protein product [Staurois parvus]